eukprot:14109308-Alexandrium_andersonii.AAC.1
MSASLVGSEMCIRDSIQVEDLDALAAQEKIDVLRGGAPSGPEGPAEPRGCLLYTSDAADDM